MKDLNLKRKKEISKRGKTSNKTTCYYYSKVGHTSNHMEGSNHQSPLTKVHKNRKDTV